MQDIDLTPALKERLKPYDRKRGRYNSSEIYGITHGYITPMQWMFPDEREVAGLLRMWNGILVHDHVQRLLPAKQNEVKKEYTKDGITLVAKVDHLPLEAHDNSVWEIKSSEDEMDKSKPSHDYQSRLYCTIFERPQSKVFQPVQDANGLYLKHLGTIERDDVWFEQEWEKLKQFNYQVEELWENR